MNSFPKTAIWLTQYYGKSALQCLISSWRRQLVSHAWFSKRRRGSFLNQIVKDGYRADGDGDGNNAGSNEGSHRSSLSLLAGLPPACEGSSLSRIIEATGKR